MLDRLIGWALGDMDPQQVKSGFAVTWRLVLAFHVAFACGFLTPIGLAGFARAEQIQTIKQDMQSLAGGVEQKVVKLEVNLSKWQAQQKRDDLEAEIRRLEQAIFEIEARLAELSRAGMPADRIYSARLAELRTSHGQVTRRLQAFLQAHPNLDDAP